MGLRPKSKRTRDLNSSQSFLNPVLWASEEEKKSLLMLPGKRRCLNHVLSENVICLSSKTKKDYGFELVSTRAVRFRCLFSFQIPIAWAKDPFPNSVGKQISPICVYKITCSGPEGTLHRNWLKKQIILVYKGTLPKLGDPPQIGSNFSRTVPTHLHFEW